MGIASIETAVSEYEFTTPEALLADITNTQERLRTSLQDASRYQAENRPDRYEFEHEVVMGGLLDRILQLKAVAAREGVELETSPRAE